MGRTLTDFERVYIDGYELSGYIVDTGERGADQAAVPSLCKSDQITGYLLGKPKIALGPIVGVFDNTPTSGLHVLSTGAQGARRNVLVAIGDMADPVMGSDVFGAPMVQTAYKTKGDGGMVGALLALEGPDVRAAMNYTNFWGRLLHVWGAETAANTANTNVDHGAATAAGGWLFWMINSITGAGTVTVSVDDSANGTTWLALAAATSGAIATASAPVAGIVQLATTATVRRYLRPQIAFGGSATACTYISAFFRGA